MCKKIINIPYMTCNKSRAKNRKVIVELLKKQIGSLLNVISLYIKSSTFLQSRKEMHWAISHKDLVVKSPSLSRKINRRLDRNKRPKNEIKRKNDNLLHIFWPLCDSIILIILFAVFFFINVSVSYFFILKCPEPATIVCFHMSKKWCYSSNSQYTNGQDFGNTV